MMLSTTLITALVLTHVYIALSANVVRLRASTDVLYGDGGAQPLLRAIRAHGNFAEYAPLFILLLALAELAGAGPAWALPALAAAFTLGRLMHAVAIIQGLVGPRVGGMVLTFGALSLTSLLGAYSLL